MLLWGERPRKTKAWLRSLCWKILDECDAMLGLVWLFGFWGLCVQTKDWLWSSCLSVTWMQHWVLFVVFYLWNSFIYHCLWLAYPYLFVCLLLVWWSYNVCVIREQMVMQMFLTQSRLRRGWNELGGLLFI